MESYRIPRGLCAVVGESLIGSHASLDALFQSSGAPGEPPDLPHHSKWKEWLFRAGQDPNVDSLKVLGNILEEFMDVEPEGSESAKVWRRNRRRVETALSENGLEYYQGGRVIPNGKEVDEKVPLPVPAKETVVDPGSPNSIEVLLTRLVNGLPRAMHPLTYRRKEAKSLIFQNEHDIQDLLHALMRPWIADIRPEEFTPSYAGSSTRMDFLLPAHEIVIETKCIRDLQHAKKVGDELIIDIAHYNGHPKCRFLWCVIFDPQNLIKNRAGLISDLSGTKRAREKEIDVNVVIV